MLCLPLHASLLIVWPDESFSEGRDSFTGGVCILGADECASTGVGIRGELSSLLNGNG